MSRTRSRIVSSETLEDVIDLVNDEFVGTRRKKASVDLLIEASWRRRFLSHLVERVRGAESSFGKRLEERGDEATGRLIINAIIDTPLLCTSARSVEERDEGRHTSQCGDFRFVSDHDRGTNLRQQITSKLVDWVRKDWARTLRSTRERHRAHNVLLWQLDQTNKLIVWNRRHHGHDLLRGCKVELWELFLGNVGQETDENDVTLVNDLLVRRANAHMRWELGHQGVGLGLRPRRDVDVLWLPAVLATEARDDGRADLARAQQANSQVVRWRHAPRVDLVWQMSRSSVWCTTSLALLQRPRSCHRRRPAHFGT